LVVGSIFSGSFLGVAIRCVNRSKDLGHVNYNAAYCVANMTIGGIALFLERRYET